MNILADQNITYVEETFSSIGEVTTYIGRELSRDHVRNADLLVCRSTKPINGDLLEGSPVRFVGTATVGTDHVEQQYLRENDIAFTNAAGSNANSVAEYVSEALLILEERTGRNLSEMSLGVVGCGNVGSRVVKKARALGMKVVENDPPLARETGDSRYRPITEIFDCDIITLHVPLTRSGPDPTWQMVDRDFIGNMKPGAILINSSRGDVVEEYELVEALRSGELSEAVLDVWHGEPKINLDLLDLVLFGTPHVAGHSLDGKVAGTAMIYRAACKHLGLEPQVDPRSFLPDPQVPEIVLKDRGRPREIVRRVALSIHNPLDDDAALRGAFKMPKAERGELFDSLRRNYGPRREFHNTELVFKSCPEGGREMLLGLGFAEKG